MKILKVDKGILLIGIRINAQKRWAAVFFGIYGLVILGSGEGK